MVPKSVHYILKPIKTSLLKENSRVIKRILIYLKKMYTRAAILWVRNLPCLVDLGSIFEIPDGPPSTTRGNCEKKQGVNHEHFLVLSKINK